jgi:hypothetical protein
MAGVLGIGADIRAWTAEQRKEAAEWIARYASVRYVIHHGDVHLAGAPADVVVGHVQARGVARVTAGVDGERREAVGVVKIPYPCPDRLLLDVGGGAFAVRTWGRRHRRDHLCGAVLEERLVRGARHASAAEHHVHSAQRGVDGVRGL